MDRKLLGGILMIVGTSLGGGMLALPVANAKSGFMVSSFLLIMIWLVMTFCAFLILEVNLLLAPNSNIISMAEATLGKSGRFFSWLIYLLLLYALISAYISGGADVLRSLLQLVHISGQQTHSTHIIVFTLCMGAVIYGGIYAVDHVNRIFMYAKLLIYILLVLCLVPHIEFTFLQGGEWRGAITTLMVLVTSFGYAIIVPSLRVYFDSDIVKLRRLILFGSIIPLICYLLWDLVIIGVLPPDGETSLVHMLHSGHTATELSTALMLEVKNTAITSFFRAFGALSILTAFLGVGISLVDFLADGLKINKHDASAWKIYAIAFLPPLVIVIFYPGIFITAFKFAGIICVLLLILLPVLMAWRARYTIGLNSEYQVIGGKPSIVIAMLIAMILLIIGVTQL